MIQRPTRRGAIVLATHNEKKLAELRRVFASTELSVEILGLSDFPPYPEPAETELTFEGNALIKARAAVLNTGIAALADDSGLEVDALNKMPGVRSARWAGPGATDQQNLDLLIAQTTDLGDDQRVARFVCALALVTPAGVEKVWRETMEGTITSTPAGENGFGYDPIFVPTGHQMTSAQLEPMAKDAISHRGRAIRAMIEEIRDLLEVMG